MNDARLESGLGRKLAASMVLAVLVFAALSLYGDVEALGESIRGFRSSELATALLLVLANYGLRIVRWEIYMRIVGCRVSVVDSTLVFLSGFVMSVTPGKIGEVFKSYLLRDRFQIPFARTAPIVVAERLTDLTALVLLTSIAALSFRDAALVAGLGAAVVSCGLVALMFRPLGLAILRVLEKPALLSRLAPKLREAYDSLFALIRPGPLVLATVISTAAWWLECVAFMVIANGFAGIDLGLLEATFVYSVSTIVGALAMMPGGLGVTEVGMTGLLETLGGGAMSAATAAAITILARLATLWFAVLIGLVAWVTFARRHRTTRSRVDRHRPASTTPVE